MRLSLNGVSRSSRASSVRLSCFTMGSAIRNDSGDSMRSPSDSGSSLSAFAEIEKHSLEKTSAFAQKHGRFKRP